MFTDLSSFLTPSGGSIFRCTTKDRGERRAKGLRSRPLESGFYTGDRRGDVRRSYVFALVQLTRFRLVRRRAGGVRFARLRRKAKHRLFAAISLSQALLPPDSCLLRPDGGASASPEEVPLGCTNCGEIVGTRRITKVLQTRQSGGCGSANHSTAVQHAEARE